MRAIPPPQKKPSLTVNPFGDFTHSSLRTTLSSDNRFSIPLLTALVPDGIKPGTIFLVEFDPESQWLAVATSIAASYLRAGGRVGYMAQLRSPETVRENLVALGVDVSAVTSEGRFTVDDWYSAGSLQLVPLSLLGP